MRTSTRKIFTAVSILALTLPLSVACDSLGGLRSKDKAIGFEVKCKTTKSAAITTGLLESKYGEFFSAALDADGLYYSAALATYGASEEDGENCWVTGQYWPEDRNAALSFWAFAPSEGFNPEGITYGTDGSDRPTASFSYTPVRNGSRNLDASDQKDFLIAYTGNQTYNSNRNHRIPVVFNHAMSAIRFKIGTVDSHYPEDAEFSITSITLNNFAASGSCIVTATADTDENTTAHTVAASNLSFAWTPEADAYTNYTQIFNADFTKSAGGSFIDAIAGLGRDGTPIEGGIFMIVPQTLATTGDNKATATINWGIWEDHTDDGADNPEFIQYPAKTADFKGISFEAGYLYTFTVNIGYSEAEGTGEIYIELTERIPWDYVPEVKNFDNDVAATYPYITFSNYKGIDNTEGNRKVILYPSPNALTCSVKLNSPKGAKLLIKIEQEFDAFTYEFVGSDQIPESDSSDPAPITFRLTPAIKNPEREYKAALSLSLRLVNGRIVNIDDQVQAGGKYQLILEKAN